MSAKIVFGVDQIISKNPEWKKQRIGLLTNDAAITTAGASSRLALLRNGFNLVRLFSPEHGINASFPDGSAVQNTIDPLTALPVVSLYNSGLDIPSPSFKGLDLILIDLQDVGVRCYTYLWSACEIVLEASKHGIKVLVLDRPNPLGGQLEWAEGPMLHPTCQSFIGKYNLPMTHYCTLGELLLYLNAEEQMHCELTIEKCHWKRSFDFSKWNLPWKAPSPGLKSFNACALYPSLCFFEASNVDLAREQSFSFEFIGAPWFENKQIESDLSMIPFHYKKNLQVIKGFQCHRAQPVSNPVEQGLRLLYEIKRVFPNSFNWSNYPTAANPSGENHLSLLTGIPQAHSMFEHDSAAFNRHLKECLNLQWIPLIKPYLMYT